MVGGTAAHYENFPVASILLPPAMRTHIAAVYAFARTADDFADEGQLSPARRLDLLEGWRERLHAAARDETTIRPPRTGEPPDTESLFRQLAATMRVRLLPVELFDDLLSAFRQDVTIHRYATWPELLDYCRRSANPVGRLLLVLYGATERAHFGWSDAICSSLQLINFLQDVAIDYRKNRVYLPQDEMVKFGVTEEHIAHGHTGEKWKAFMAFQVERARALLYSGAPLGRALKGRIGLELRMIIAGGARILEKIERIGGDVFHRRPVLRPADWPLMLLRAV